MSEELIAEVLKLLRGPHGRELAQLVLRRAKEDPTTLRTIIAAASLETGFAAEEITGPSQRAAVTLARSVTAHIAHLEFFASYSEIGRLLNRDHSTIIAGVRRIRHRIEDGDSKVIDLRERVLARLRAGNDEEGHKVASPGEDG